MLTSRGEWAVPSEGGPLKPKLLFFRWIADNLPDFIRLHLDQQVACLERSFDVTLVNEEDCDYDEVCDRYRPDLALFESGVYVGRRRITNTATHPEVPKLGLLHSDAYCASRATFISDMERWGIEEFFTLAVSAGEYTPQIADRLFVWPNFIDEKLYRDYGESKVIPVLFTGSQATHYPWRNRISRVVTQVYPTLVAPHGGWGDRRKTARMVLGEQYARMLNAAMVAPTCGTTANEIVRKHFEIPAARTCLVTERTPAVEAAGFADMESCIFVDENDVIDKLDYLFGNPDELRRITDAGFELVHSRHTAAQRDQIRQWYDLHRALGPGQRIVQNGPFEPLTVVDASPTARNVHVISGVRELQLLRRADELVRSGQYRDAERVLLGCLNYHFMPEPILRLAICYLRQGDAVKAAEWLARPIETTLKIYGAMDPDPVEWAYYVRALLCQGRVDDAAGYAARFPALCHPELDRIRAVTARLQGRGTPAASGTAPRRTVHDLPMQNLSHWTKELGEMLRACGQEVIASALSATADKATGAPLRPRSGPINLTPWHIRTRRRVMARVRPLLPGRQQQDPLDDAIRALASKEVSHAALLVGSSATAGPAGGLLAGLRGNANRPALYWSRDPSDGAITVDDGARYLDTALAEVRVNRGLARFDLALVAEPGAVSEADLAEIERAALIVVVDINEQRGYEIVGALLESDEHHMVAHDPEHGSGYAIFCRSMQSVPAMTVDK